MTLPVYTAGPPVGNAISLLDIRNEFASESYGGREPLTGFNYSLTASTYYWLVETEVSVVPGDPTEVFYSYSVFWNGVYIGGVNNESTSAGVSATTLQVSEYTYSRGPIQSSQPVNLNSSGTYRNYYSIARESPLISADTQPYVLSDYYAGGSFVSTGTVGYPGGVETSIPSSPNAISFSNFHGATKIITGIMFNIGELSLTATLPKAAVWLGIKMVGGGGGGGGNDNSPRTWGGDGGAGVLGIGNVRLPETTGLKLIYTWCGRGGRQGQQGASENPGGAGGTGGTFVSSGYTTITGGAGARDGNIGSSGSGAGGGGPTFIFYQVQGTSQLIPIMMVSGGGGGGGTGRNGTANTASNANQNNRNTIRISFTSDIASNGNDGQIASGYDGGGAGGGGAPSGLGGTVTIANETRATGGSAGYSYYNSSLNWESGSPFITNPTLRTQFGANSYGIGGIGINGPTAGTFGAVSAIWNTSFSRPSSFTPPAI